MALSHSPKIVTDGLVFCVDAGDVKSYSGGDWKDRISSGHFDSTIGSPTYDSDTKSWDFTGGNYALLTTNSTSTRTDTEYTRIAWFYCDTVPTSSDPSYIFLNRIGNNSDLCLCVANSSLCFHQYQYTQSNGTGNGDYTIYGVEDLVAGRWYMGAFTFDKPNTTLKLYVNGQLDKTTTSTNVVGDGSSNTIMLGGPYNVYLNRYFDGKVAAAYHYNRVLTDAEILQNFNALKGRFGL